MFYKGIYINVIYKNIKSIRLSFKKDGIFLTCSKRVSNDFLNSFLDKHYIRIKRFNDLKNSSNIPTIHYLGKLYPIKFSLAKSNKVYVLNDYMLVEAKRLDDLYLAKVLKDFYKSSLDKYFNLYLKDECLSRANMCGIFTNDLNFSFVYTNTVLGKCNNKREIVLSGKLMKYSDKYIKSVIYHELCHLVYLNHSPLFHKLLNKVDVNSKYLNRELKDEKYIFDFI